MMAKNYSFGKDEAAVLVQGCVGIVVVERDIQVDLEVTSGRILP